jgi:hypothetical protein
MFALILESPKLILMFVLIGTIIVLSHFGGQPAKARVRSRTSPATARRRSSLSW